MIRESFSKMSSWAQLFFLIVFCFFGLIIGVVLISPLGFIMGMDNLNFMRISQVIQSVCLFLLPAVACAYLFQKNTSEYLKINKPINFKILLYSILLIISIQPFISFTGYYNKMMELPVALEPLENIMKQMEDASALILNKLLADRSTPIIIFNFFVIAVVAGITEEFFFRGSMQQIFKKISNNKHVAIWITAFIFSFIHLQFYGFFPRLFLGALLGYIFVWSGNLWIPVIVHTCNNALSVLIYYKYHGTPVYDQLENVGVGDTIWTTGASVAISGIIIFLLIKEYSFYKNKQLEY